MKVFKTVGVVRCRQYRLIHTVSKFQQACFDSLEYSSKESKQLRGHNDTISPIKPVKDDKTIRHQLQSLNKAKSSKEIIQFLKFNVYIYAQKGYIDPAIYGKAIQLCCNMRDYNAAKDIIDLMLSRLKKEQIPSSTEVVFSIFFNAMTKSDQPMICYQYFMKMTKELNITPNLITFSTLIKSCRYQGKSELAETYWKLMENTYNIKPNNYLYNEIISVYSKGNQSDKAIETFDKWFNESDDTERKNKESLPLFGTYLNIFSRIGDMNGMENALNLIRKYKHKLNIVLYGDLMRGSIVARQPYKAIEFYKKSLNDQLTPSAVTLRLKGVALCHIIKDDDKLEFQEKVKVYKRLLKHFTKTYPKYGQQESPITASIVLTASIALFHNVDPRRIVDIFEQYESKYHLSYRKTDDDCIIDLHCFHHLQVQFLLRYIVGYKLNKFDLNERNGLDVIVGKSKHGIKAGLDGKYSLKDFVKDELMKYEPPIKCEQHSNPGLLFIPKHQLLPYIGDDDNYAKSKLSIPSDDWYLSDPRVASYES